MQHLKQRSTLFDRFRSAVISGDKRQQKKHTPYPYAGMNRAYMVSPGQPVWMERDYGKFADEAYMKNVIAHRAIAMIAQGAASVGISARYVNSRGVTKTVDNHPALNVLMRPNPQHSRSSFFTDIYHQRLISGNAFVLAVGPRSAAPHELHALRPDRVVVVAGQHGMPSGYRYTVGQQSTHYAVERISGFSRVLHCKNFHPLNDWYGLSPIEAAAYSIDQHNQSGAWNQALLQNGARPSGALMVKSENGQPGNLSEDQFYRLKQQMDEQFSGAANAGRPMLLEGGLEWKDMSLSPRDMDFISIKHSAARDIALAFGVPPQLLGIPGDNTYANLQEARLALWEQTIVPLVESTLECFSPWLSFHFDTNITLKANIEAIPALAMRNQAIWERVENASFMTEDEKRAAVGLGKKE